jgi:restriction endonuclease S subunit
MAITAKDEIKKTVGIETENVKIPAGFKLAELDGNPHDCLFGDFFISRPAKKNISTEDYVTFLGMNDISEHGGILRQHSIRASEVKAGLTVFEQFDILVAKITPCFENGKGACLDLLETMVGFGSTEFHVLRAKPQVAPRYIYYHTRLLTFRRQLEREMIGTAGQKRVPMKAIENYRLQVKHSYLEQQAIAATLSDIDSLITSLEQLIAKKRDIKQATMQRLLTGKQRLPGFSGEWSFKTLGHCLMETPAYGINAPAVPYQDNLPRYIRITDITEDGYFSTEKLSSVKTINSEKYLLTDGDLVFARTGASVGKSYLYNSKDGHLVFAGFLIKVKPNPKYLLSNFLASYAKTHQYKNWVRLISMRSGQPGINGNEYAQMPLQLPGLSEQHAIANILSDMNTEITALEQQLDKTRDLKQGMMQELLTGRIRLV